MRSILAVLAFCLAMSFGVSGDVAEAQPAPLFKCKASSYRAVGWGWGPERDYAARRALYECAIRTPHDDACYIDWCVRVR